jgi:hypothetical protein
MVVIGMGAAMVVMGMAMGAAMVVMGMGAAMVVIGMAAEMEPYDGAPIMGAAPYAPGYAPGKVVVGNIVKRCTSYLTK